MEPTPEQLQACRHANLDPANARWEGRVMVLPYWGGENLWALVSEHGSITFCPEPMLDAHIAGIPK